MKFSDFILYNAIVTDLKAKNKEEVISEMVQALVDAGGLKSDDVDAVVEKIRIREELGSTGIGHGIAVPHTKFDNIDKLVGTVAISQGEGVDFDSLDCEKVKLFFLLVSPTSQSGEHLRALEHITNKLRDEGFVRYLKQCYKFEDVKALLEEADE